MSSGGGSSGGTSTTTTDLPSWAQPYASDLLQRGSDLSNTTVPTYTGQMTAGLSGTQQAGLNSVNAAASNAGGLANATSNAATNAANQGLNVSNPYSGNIQASTAANSFADPSNNPYLANSVNASNQAITQAYNSSTAPQTLAQFRNAGAFGGSAQQQATSNNQYQLGNALSNNTANMYNAAYNTAAGVASQNAQQQNTVNMSNQAIGTNANNAYNQNLSSNYYNTLGAAVNANNAYGTTGAGQLTAGGVQQQNSQDQLNSLYQQWYNQVNQPYAQLSTLSSALSGALGSGAGTSVTQQMPGSSNTLGSALGLGQIGAGLYGAMSQ